MELGCFCFLRYCCCEHWYVRIQLSLWFHFLWPYIQEENYLLCQWYLVPSRDLGPGSCSVHTWLEWAGQWVVALASVWLHIFLSLLRVLLMLADWEYLSVAEIFSGQKNNLPCPMILSNLFFCLISHRTGWAKSFPSLLSPVFPSPPVKRHSIFYSYCQGFSLFHILFAF